MPVLHGWSFCPRCASTLEVGPGRVECGRCGFVAYANPAAAACALVVDDEGRLLLARRAAEVEHGKWDLPGGFVEEGEHPLAAVVRELREETGLEIEPTRFFGIWMDWYESGPGARSTLGIYWLARPIGGELEAADDVSELRWFAREDLPPAREVAFRSVPEVLAAWRDEHA